jgi:large repetitive protein
MKPGFQNNKIFNKKFHIPCDFILVSLLLIISLEGSGQCVNPPTVTLSSTTGSVCGLTPVTVSGNIFGGGATKVTLTENGDGTLSPTSATASPFSFTYTPKSKDIGKIIVITLTTNIPAGSGCTAAKAIFNLTVNPVTSTPGVGTITQPTCTVVTGSVLLNGLPSSGIWTITRTPGGVVTGTGTSTTISGIEAGSYTFNVTSSSGCTSSASASVIIKAQPASPAAPVATIDCSLGAGKAGITVTSPVGSGLQYRLDGGTFQSKTSFSNIANGNHTISVINSLGCTTTGTSFTILCGCANPPTLTLNSTSGSTCGTAPLTVSGNTFGGSATSVTITENGEGTVSPSTSSSQPFAFTYTPAAGDAGKSIIISITAKSPSGLSCPDITSTYILTVNANPSAPAVTVTQPACTVATGNVVLNGLPASGIWTITRTPGGVTTGTGTSTTISGIEPGSYTFNVTSSSGCTSSASASVIINAQPASPAVPAETIDCSLGAGKARITVTSPVESGLQYRLDGGAFQSNTSFINIANGPHTISVINSSGCTTTGTSFTILCGCVNPPALTLSSTSGSTCGTAPLTVSGNTFGGSATSVTITENGEGTVSPSTSSSQPFAFTYTPAAGDAGKSIIISITAKSPSGLSCPDITATYILTVNANPSAPVVTVTQPACTVATGNVVLNGLPANGIWTITRTPGGVVTGTGTSTTISGIEPGSYTFNVTSSSGCTSSASESVIINAQPVSPTTPVATIDCSLGAGKAGITVTSPVGSGLQYRLDGGAFLSKTSFTNIANGPHTISVINSSGCTTTGTSFTILCGCVNPPILTLSSTSGSTCGTAPLTVSGNTFGGSATSVTITENGEGTISPSTSSSQPFAFTYAPAAGDAGKSIIISITANSLSGLPCTDISATYVLTVNANPPAPVGTVYQPTCTVPAGSVVLKGLPESGIWTLNQTPGGIIFKGAGASTTISGLAAGTYAYTVENAAACISGLSANMTVSPQPAIPSVPWVSSISQPTSGSGTGSVTINGLPESGSWILKRIPGDVTISGTGTIKTITGLSSGIYAFTVTNSSGCTSGISASFSIYPPPDAVLFVVKDPDPVCFPSTVDITAPEITAGSSEELSFTYWNDAAATIRYNSPAKSTAGTYYIKGITNTGFVSVKPVLVTVHQAYIANAGDDQVLEYTFGTTLNAEPPTDFETGVWSVISGTGVFSDISNAGTSVNELSIGENKFLWTVSGGVCPESGDTVMIIVHDLVIKTLITPNMDGRNDYFVLKRATPLEKTELVIFDRRGVQVYRNENYDNSWNGVDYKGNPLPDDTYYCIVKTANDKKISGYIVIRR